MLTLILLLITLRILPQYHHIGDEARHSPTNSNNGNSTLTIGADFVLLSVSSATRSNVCFSCISSLRSKSSLNTLILSMIFYRLFDKLVNNHYKPNILVFSYSINTVDIYKSRLSWSFKNCIIGIVVIPLSSLFRRMLSAVTMIFLKESPIERRDRVSCSTLPASGILQADCI